VNEHDRALVFDILAAAANAIDFVGEVTLVEFGSDLMRRMAVERCIEIIGEAAGKFSREFRDQHGERLPLRAAVRTRNRFIHGYRTINYSMVYDTVIQDLPDLVDQLQSILKDAP
jgi:uncharacterized protein with HEPN domain